MIDDRCRNFNVEDSSLIKELCARSFGIGADGVILLRGSSVADFQMRIFNSDGCEADMCGNGLRCLVSFIRRMEPQIEAMTIETKSGIHSCLVNGDKITTGYSDPKNITLDFKLEIEGESRIFHLINTGVPHAIHFTKHKEDQSFLPVSRVVRRHPFFSPHGTNVSFAYLEKSMIFLRTYERGVEDQTFACGTAAVAASCIAYLKFGLKSPRKIEFSSLETVVCEFSAFENEISQVSLTGSSKHVFDGNFIKT